MTDFKPQQLAEQVVAKTGDKLIAMNDQYDRFYIVHPTNNKALAVIKRGEDPAKNVRLQRVNGQNTANCLIMQNIDLTQPFSNHEQFGRGLTKQEREEFEDSLISVYKHHQIMCQNGYALWYCDLVIGENSVTVHNEYVVRPHETSSGTTDLEIVELRAYVHTHKVKEMSDLHKVPSFWVTAKDVETDALGAAEGYMETQGSYKLQVAYSAHWAGNKPQRRISAMNMSQPVLEAFGVYRIHELRITSRPGAVNAIKIYQYSDDLGNARELRVVSNMG